MVGYTVACRFVSGDQELASKWLAWLRDGHLQDVISGGARSAEVIRIDDGVPHYEIHYRFETREALDRYLRDFAPHLREEGLSKFPLSLGLEYRRSTGEFCLKMPASED
ncbi:MAG: DUF4286 family protein [Planctomycetota bacterium]